MLLIHPRGTLKRWRRQQGLSSDLTLNRKPSNAGTGRNVCFSLVLFHCCSHLWSEQRSSVVLLQIILFCKNFIYFYFWGKFIAIQAHLKKQEKSQINNLTLHLKQLEKEEMKNPRVSRRKEILKIRVLINAKEKKRP